MEIKLEYFKNKFGNNNLSVPVAIILAGLMISGAILISAKIDSSEGGSVAVKNADNSALLEKVRSVSSSDHIRGNPNAKVKVVEYSDTECPYCKQFHATMKQIVEKYNGEVAWVYRHFPIDRLHPRARNESIAMECANELGGNDKFWQYADRLYEITPANNGLDPAELPKIAQYVGLDTDSFNRCLASNKYGSRIDADIKNGTESGGGGTPWSIVIAKNGKKFPISGAYPLEAVSQIIDQALKEK